VTVETSDTQMPITNLIIAGRVDTFYALSPNMVKLEGAVGKKINSTITIAADEKYPFKIIGARARMGRDIRYEFKPVKYAGGEKYLLNVENLKKQKGRYNDIIYLKTDKKQLPEIMVRVLGNITDVGPKSNKQK
jgi:hypothetical protein